MHTQYLARTISTGVAAAAVQSLLTVGARVALWAAAAVATGRVLHTGSSVEARSVCTRHGADLTVGPVEALRARAHVTVYHVL